MGFANFINSRPGGGTSGTPATTTQGSCGRRFKCTCGNLFHNAKDLGTHQKSCTKINEKKGLLKRKANATGYEDGASVRFTASHSKFRTHIRLWNRMKNDRAVTRSHTRHKNLAIPPLASQRTSTARKERIIAEGENENAEEGTVEFDISGSGFLDEKDAAEAGIDIEAASVSSVECEPCTDDEEEEESDEDEDWEDVQESTVDNLQRRLRDIKIKHNRRWAKF